jgi:putative oxidoreductase
MRALGLTRMGRLADLAPLFLRLGVGLVFAWHGWQKFVNGPENFAGFLDSLGVPAPEIVAWLQTLAEGVGGLMLMVGLLTRLTTLPLIVIMIGAIVLVKDDVGFIAPQGAPLPGAEFDLTLLVGLVALLLLGPGRTSVDHAAGIEPTRVVNEYTRRTRIFS